MAQLPSDPNLLDDRTHADRRSSTALNKTRRFFIEFVHSKWVASFIVAMAVSWSFSEVDSRQTDKLARQEAVTLCVIENVSTAQDNSDERVNVRPILQACEKQQGN